MPTNASLRKTTALCSAACAAALWLASVAALGVNALVPYGLALGTAVSNVCLGLIGASIERAVATGKRGTAYTQLLLRVCLYAAALLVSARLGALAVFACAAGALIPFAAFFVLYRALPALRRFRGAPPEEYRYVKDGGKRVLERKPAHALLMGGRLYVTHRSFSRYKRVKP